MYILKMESRNSPWFRLKILLIICIALIFFVFQVKATKIYGCAPECVKAGETSDLQIEPNEAEIVVYSGVDLDVSCTRLESQEFLKSVKKTPEWTGPNGIRIPHRMKTIELRNDIGSCTNMTWVNECVNKRMKPKFCDNDNMCSSTCRNEIYANSAKESNEKDVNEKKNQKHLIKEKESKNGAKRTDRISADVEVFCGRLSEEECTRDCKIEKFLATRSSDKRKKEDLWSPLRWTVAECDRTWLIKCLRSWVFRCEAENQRRLMCYKERKGVPKSGCFPQVSTICSFENIYNCWRNCQLVTAEQNLTGSTVNIYPVRCSKENSDQCKESLNDDRTFLADKQIRSDNGICSPETEEDKNFTILHDHITQHDNDKCDITMNMMCRRRCHLKWILGGLNINLKDNLRKDRNCRVMCAKMESNNGIEEGTSGIFCEMHCMVESLKRELDESENRQVDMKIKFKGIKASDEGEYRCQVPGGSKAKCFELNVIASAPGVMDKLATLTCSLRNTSNYILWYYQDTLIENSTVYKISSDNTSLSIRPTQTHGEYGKYECREMASDNITTSKTTRVLYRVKIPNPPKIEVVENTLRNTSVKIQATIDESQVTANDDGGSRGSEETPRVLPIDGYVVQYKLTHRSVWLEMKNKTEQITIGKKNISLDCQSLEPEKTYYVRVAYRNKVTLGHYSEHIKFRTGDRDPTNKECRLVD